ncbi:uncharacterized protein BYT42DRAFT_550179 [Radiomyces spectabilis]|uniref:uncharacterized protein n=1 Tax=Radiomyces spectabilis TaxID=64574 RepID=UPI00221F9457|nr:uncharacterized protein BYT42DRAFT_550179 [Radiomyces spectabilis]KAI8365309.1 hypothetical protein BYT42DRAFT_550179 [Radiomyces spectabilis]
MYIFLNSDDYDDIPKKSPKIAKHDEFTKGRRFHLGLKLDSARRSNLVSEAYDCEAIALHLEHETMEDPDTVRCLTHADELHNACLKLPFSSRTTTLPMTRVLQVHKDDDTAAVPHQSQAMATVPDETVFHLKQTICKSWLPNVMDRLDDYEEPSNELQAALNFDSRQGPALIQSVAKLFTGSLVVDTAIIFIIVAEANGRSKAVDVHSETSLKSHPIIANGVYS